MAVLWFSRRYELVNWKLLEVNLRRPPDKDLPTRTRPGEKRQKSARIKHKLEVARNDGEQISSSNLPVKCEYLLVRRVSSINLFCENSSSFTS